MRQALAILAVAAVIIASLAAAAVMIRSGHPPTPPGGVVYAEELSEPELVWRVNNFTIELYGRLLSSHPGENIVASPFNVYVALTLLYEGAAGETREEIEDVMNIRNADLCNAYKELLSKLPLSSGEPSLAIANSVWLREGYVFRDEYVGRVSSCYSADVHYFRTVDELVDSVNSWVSEKTNGMIKKAMGRPDTDEVAAVLVSVIYFRARWVERFDEQAIISFHTPEGVVNAPGMSGLKTRASYFKGDGYVAVMLPYENTSVSMIIIMPDDREALTSRYAEMISESLRYFRKHPVYDGKIYLTMPKFEIRLSENLNQYLEDMGMPSAFDPDKADFSRMTPMGVWVDDVIHTAAIRVAENGTEASAATVIVMTLGLPAADVYLTINKPFIYLLWDRDTGTILFVGQVTNPVVG